MADVGVGLIGWVGVGLGGTCGCSHRFLLTPFHFVTHCLQDIRPKAKLQQRRISLCTRLRHEVNSSIPVLW